MKFYTGNDFQNHKEIKIRYFNRKTKSTDNLFDMSKGDTLHKLYNNFLINQYLFPKKRYRNALNNSIQGKNDSYLNYQNNFQDISERNNNNIYRNSSTIEVKESHCPLYNYNRFIKKNFHNNRYNEDNKINYHYELPKLDYSIQKSIQYNYDKIDCEQGKENHSERCYNNFIHPYDFKKAKNKNNLPKIKITPVVEKIIKHNYIMKNPFSEKKDYLGPSSLKNNPILYPISTYKFDFKRFMRDYYVHKFI